MGWKSILYFEIVTTFALMLGLIAINISKAGEGIRLPPGFHQDMPEAIPQSWQEVILHIFPENIVKSIYNGDVLPIVIFSVIFGIALAMLSEKRRKPMLEFSESLAETMFKFTNIIMYFAPFGVGAAIAVTVGHLGLDILASLLLLLVTLYIALIVFMLIILLPVALIIRLPVRKFISAISEPVSIAFATTSSESALPKAMENMENWRAAQDRIVCTAYRIHIQSGWYHLISFTGFGVCSPGCRDPHDHRSAGFNGPNPHAYQ